jgi:hypothetical protein
MAVVVLLVTVPPATVVRPIAVAAAVVPIGVILRMATRLLAAVVLNGAVSKTVGGR